MIDESKDEVFINLNGFLQVIQKEKIKIFIIIVIFTLAGVIISITQKDEFISNGKLLPESQNGSTSNDFQGLAALAGINFGEPAAGGDAIRPDLYPDVIQSTEFFMNLFRTKVKIEGKEVVDFERYYFERIINEGNKELKLNFKNIDGNVYLGQKSEEAVNELKKRISCSYDKKTGIIIISAKMPDAVVAASIASFTMNYLKNYIINYRTEKQRRDLNFLSEKLMKAEGKYYNLQSKKANYMDKMPLTALRMLSSDLQRERIEKEYQNSSSFYNTLLQKYEEAKLKIQQETPILKVLDPPIIPNKPSEPIRSKIILGSLIIGLFVSLIFVIFINKNYLKITRV
jgi:uncharacterized protein involved in exopolysaccharide biosynthesis